MLTSRSLERAVAAVEDLHKDATYDAAFKAGNEIVPMQLDIDDEASIKNLRQKVGDKFGRIVVRVHNAGMSPLSWPYNRSVIPLWHSLLTAFFHAAVLLDFAIVSNAMTTKGAFDQSFATNVTSVNTLTEILVDLVIRSSSGQIVFVSSGIGSLADHTNPNYLIKGSPPAGWPKPCVPNNLVYRTSKTAMNMLALEWRRILKNDGTKINIITPGLSATSLGGLTPDAYRTYCAEEPSVGGVFIRNVTEGKRDEGEGKGILKHDGVIPWRNPA